MTVIFCCADMTRTVASAAVDRFAALARCAPEADTELVASWGSFSFLYGPIVAFAVVGLLIVLLRWTFRRGHSLVAAPPRPGTPDEYGLLVAVAEPASFAEAELIRSRLAAQGVRATLAPTTQGPRVMVFRDEARVARALLRGPR
jgi:hypothetical protein